MLRKLLITATAVFAVGLAIACSSAPAKPAAGPSPTHVTPAAACEHGTLANGSCAEAGTPQSIIITGTTAATTAAAPAGPATTITDGTWTVGEDIQAGTYKTTGSGSTCYWSITKTGSNGADIINNHIGGGNLRVTLKAGQDFETSRCGTWAKV